MKGRAFDESKARPFRLQAQIQSSLQKARRLPLRPSSLLRLGRREETDAAVQQNKMKRLKSREAKG